VNRLPTAIDQLRGLRAARWIRESTRDQYDRYGPDAQREMQDHAIAKFGLSDTGLTWSPAESGSTVHESPAMRQMLEAAGAGRFDVLVVAYVARWQRNLRQTLNLLEDELHPARVCVWFEDEEAMTRLDAEEREARRPREVEGVPADVAVRYLRELSTTWQKADGGPGRRMLAEALFSRIEVLGAREATIHLTDAAVAHGFAAAIPDRLDVTVGYGRGERSRAFGSRLIRGCTVVMANEHSPLDLAGIA
jgi:hypothetical protein